MTTDALTWFIPLPPILAFALIVLFTNRSKALSHILAVGAARQVPVVQDGEVRPGWRMTATITIDHRVSDGAEAARFLQALGIYLEAPLRLLI